MRIILSLAAILLLAFAAVGVYFAPNIIRLWSENPSEQQASERKEAEARKTLAFASLTERLPKGKPITPRKGLDAESKKRWEILDQNLARHQDQRAELLKALHEKTRKFFVESPGEGPRRPVWPNPDELLLDEVYKNGDPSQPGLPADFPVSPGETLTRVNADDEFHFYHDIGLSDFLHPFGFGYIKDRDHVAGFSSHGFRNLGVPAHESKRWRINHVQLVGILSHEQPVVYLTDKLPSMEQVRQGKTRTLDYFEEAALPSLRDGEDLYIVSKDDTIRMLGALRATKICQNCHDAEVGDLLGAFSYTLRPAPKETKQ
ncbi:MAG: hypothetical protein L0Y72_09120 [Gemmataceae bacterium]|nr:hypothetical protein [Gemmataceae bacterium]MCI0739192.1 hypothetical protein [Gemmataceae bacterium]